MRIKWESIIDEIALSLLPQFASQAIKPTLRTIFYGLVAKNAIPNTKAAYKTLSRKLVEARKDGRFAWDFMEDRTRYSLGYFDDIYPDDGILEWVKEMCRGRLESLSVERLVDGYFAAVLPSFHVGLWALQPIVPEIWIEKDALAKTIEAWVQKQAITIRVNRGYSSWTFIYNNVQELRRLLFDHERIAILYLGDLDPSGVDIERFLEEALSYFGLARVDFHRVAVTEEQVERYGLPPRPEDAETLKKLGRDPRTGSYSYNYIVELDALVVFAPEDFRKLLLKKLDSYFDEDIYNACEREADELFEEARRVVESAKEEARQKLLEQLKGSVI